MTISIQYKLGFDIDGISHNDLEDILNSYRKYPFPLLLQDYIKIDFAKYAARPYFIILGLW